MNRTRRAMASLAAVLAVAGGSLVFLGCEGDSAESIIRDVLIRVAGLYLPPSGSAAIVAGNTGSRVSQLDLRQDGDHLEAVDNNGQIFRGTIGRATEDQASFTLEGRTTADQPVTISGSISVPVGSTEGTMRGTWIEPNLFAPVYAIASVPLNEPTSTDTNTTDGTDGGTNTTSGVTLSPETAEISITNSSMLTATFTASGGTSPYAFFIDRSDLGSLSASGDTATYTADEVAGTQIIRVFDSTADTDFSTITQIP